MLVFNDTSLFSRKSGLESQRSDNISFNAAVGNQQVQSSGVVYVSLPATVFGLVHQVQLTICPCPRIYYTVQKYKIMKRGLSFLMHKGVVLAGAPHARVPSQPGFKVAPKMKRLGHKIQPVPHTLCETQCLSLSKLRSS